MTTDIEKSPLSEISETESAAIAEEELIPEPVVREVGETIAFANGRDYNTTRVRVVPSMYAVAQDHEKWIYVSQNKNMGVSLSLATIEALVAWAKSRK
jgi:hypothetical protein